MTRHNTITPATLKVKPKPPYLDVLGAQLQVLSATMKAFQKHLKTPRLTDEQWIATANGYAANIARLYSLAVETVPPDEHAALHRYYIACVRSFHDATTTLFEAANTNQALRGDGYRRANELVVRGWRWWSVVARRATRALNAQKAVSGLEDAELVA